MTVLSQSERRRRLRPSAAALTGFIADAYREAALAQADMRRAVDILERLRTATVETSDFFTLWLILDGEVGQSAGDSLQSCLTSVRAKYVDEVIRLINRRVEKAVQRSPAEGRREWMRAYADAFGEYRWALCRRLAEEEPSFDHSPAASFQRWADDALSGRWNRVMPAVQYLLAHAELDDPERAQLLAMAAQLEIYRLGDRFQGKRYIDEAVALWPSGAKGWESLGCYHTEVHEWDNAVQAFKRSIELDPIWAGGYRGLGELALQRSDPEGAKLQYLHGISAAPGGADNYVALIRLYGRREYFAENESRLDLLAEGAIAADPDAEYDIMVILGCVYRDNQKYGQAEDLFTRAIASAPDRFEAYEEHGHLLLNKQELSQARERFQAVVRLAPDNPNGYFALGAVCEQEDDLEAALGHYQESVRQVIGPYRPDYQAQLAKAQARAGHHQLAVDTVLAAIAESPDADVLMGTAREIAVERARAGDDAAATGLASRLRSLPGTSSEALYQELLGAIAFATGKYPEAAAAFSAAIAADGSDAGLHRSLAAALRQLEQWPPAKQELERALALDGNQALYREQLSTMLNEEAAVLISAGRFEEAAEGYRHASELDPGNATIHSNLALAYEWGAQPGHRLEALQAAIAALTQATELSDDAGYSLRLIRLKRQEKAARRFGELILVPAVVTPIRVEFASDLVDKVDPARDGKDFLKVDIPAMRERVREALGYEVPAVRLSEDPALPSGGYAINLFNVLMARGQVVTGHFCVTPPEAVPGQDAIAGTDPVTGTPCAWVGGGHLDKAEFCSARYLSDTGFVLYHLEELLRQNGFWFLATDEAENWITAAEEAEALEQGPSPRNRVGLTRVLRALVRDGVKLDRLTEMLAAIGEGGMVPEEIPRALDRIRLSRRNSLPGNADDVVKISVDLPITTTPSPGAHAGEGWRKPLPPEEEQQLMDTIAGKLGQDVRYALVVAEPRLRGYVRRLVESGIRQGRGRVVDVLAAQEVLHPEATP